MLRSLRHRLKAAFWKLRRKPDGAGSAAAKWIAIRRAIEKGPSSTYGWNDGGLDERIVEYPWVFDRLRALVLEGDRVLDAGSVLNHAPIIDLWRRFRLPPLSIVTLADEKKAFVSDSVRYEFADLRDLPYKDDWFSVVICVSTLEHVGLDNRIYGSDVEASPDPAPEAIRAMRELHRVARPGARLLLTVPFGTASMRTSLRVLDGPELSRVIDPTLWQRASQRFFRARKHGWRECTQNECADAGYNEPRARRAMRTAPKFVAAAEAVALVELIRR